MWEVVRPGWRSVFIPQGDLQNTDDGDGLVRYWPQVGPMFQHSYLLLFSFITGQKKIETVDGLNKRKVLEVIKKSRKSQLTVV